MNSSFDVVARTSRSIAAVPGLPADTDWHDESALIAELATLNSRIARYITKTLDADARRRETVDVAEQAALGRQLVELGHVLLDRDATT